MICGSTITCAVSRTAIFHRSAAYADNGVGGLMHILQLLTIVLLVAQAPAKEKIPELASSSFAWLANGADWIQPAAGVRGPIRPYPDHPFHGNLDGPGQVTLRIGNYKDPVLKPWAAAQMRESNEEVLSGKRGLPFSAQSRCYPGGVPGQLLFPAEPF